MNKKRKLKLCSISESGNMRLINKLNEETFFDLLKSNEILKNYQNYRRSRAMFSANADKFTVRLKSVLEKIIKPQQFPTRPVQEHLLRDMSAEFFNVLSSFYAFLSFVEAWLKKNFESELSAFKLITNKYFDENFEYRFFYKLRNYAVHLGVPIEIIRQVEINKKKHLMISLSIQKLLDNYKKWGKVKTDLEERLNDGMILLPSAYFNFGK